MAKCLVKAYPRKFCPQKISNYMVAQNSRSEVGMEVHAKKYTEKMSKQNGLKVTTVNLPFLTENIPYSQGIQFSQLTVEPQKLNPRNKSLTQILANAQLG